MKPALGLVATCRHGRVGLITHSRPFHGRPETTVYIGVCLSPGHEGAPWQSIDPQDVMTFQDLLNRHVGGASGL